MLSMTAERSILPGLILVCAPFCLGMGGQPRLAQSAQAPPVLPRAPQAEVTTLTRAGYFSEPSIAVNTGDPKQVVVAYQNEASIAYSDDSGTAWLHAANTA